MSTSRHETFDRSVRYIRHYAAEKYRVNPDQLFLIGEGSGGYLTTMAGLLPFGSGVKTYHPWDNESDKVAGVITLNGITVSSIRTKPFSWETHRPHQ